MISKIQSENVNLGRDAHLPKPVTVMTLSIKCPNFWGRRGTADSFPCHGKDSGGSTHLPRHFNRHLAQ